MELVTIFRSFSPAEAHLVCSRLQAAEFNAAVMHELATLSMEGYSMSTGGVLVQVPAAEAVEAKAFLDGAVEVPVG